MSGCGCTGLKRVLTMSPPVYAPFDISIRHCYYNVAGMIAMSVTVLLLSFLSYIRNIIVMLLMLGHLGPSTLKCAAMFSNSQALEQQTIRVVTELDMFIASSW